MKKRLFLPQAAAQAGFRGFAMAKWGYWGKVGGSSSAIALQVGKPAKPFFQEVAGAPPLAMMITTFTP
jgi:hypothetical protein